MPIWLIQFVVSIVLTFVIGLVKQAMSSTSKKKAVGFRGQAQVGGKVPQSFLVGTIGVPGRREYPVGSWGSDGETTNAYRVDIFSLGDLPINALTGIYVFGEKITKSSSGHVTQGYPIPEYARDSKNHLWWEFLDGSQTTANSYLTSKFGSDADRPWLSDMVGRGIPYVTMTALVHENLWPGEPAYMFEAQGIKLYDPRKDTTAGGSGSHRLNDQSTWEWTDNNAVIIYNIALGIQYDGDRVWGGGYQQYQLPYSVWAAAMNACDASIDLAGGGTEKAFRGGREVFFNERPADVMEEFLVGCNGRIARSDGKLYIHVGAPPSASASFSDDDLIISEAQTFNLFPDLDGAVNGASGTFLAPEQAWEFKEASPYSRTGLVTEDDGRPLADGIELGTTFSGTQAQRILKAIVEESRRFKQHVVVLPPQFGIYRPLQTLAWTSSRNGYTAKLFLITSRTVGPNGNVIVTLYECDPTDYSWDKDVDEQPIFFAPIVPWHPTAMAMTGWNVAQHVHYDGSANARRPGILVSFAGQLDGIRAIRVQVRASGATSPFFDAEFPYDAAVETPAQPVIANSILGNETYEVRGKYVRYDNAPTLWSNQEMEYGEAVDGPWFEITTPNVPDVTQSQIIEAAGDILNQMGQIRTLIEQFKQVGTLIEEQDRENFHLRNSLFREISVQMGELEASFTEIIEVALGPGGAIATALESLYAAMGGNTAEVNVKWEAVAAPAGYEARYAVQAAVNDGTFRSATFFLDVPSNPAEPTRIGFAAGQTVFFTSGGDPIALMDENGHFKSANGVVDIDMINGDFSITVPD